jgi:hypothetical protein
MEGDNDSKEQPTRQRQQRAAYKELKEEGRRREGGIRDGKRHPRGKEASAREGGIRAFPLPRSQEQLKALRPPTLVA